jgi:tRNA isopentenyltransferase (miaA)
MSPPLVVIGGITATGKTGLAIRLAEALIADGWVAEVISADSRQVYRGLDIGTAKVTPEERRGVVHHGLDLVDPDEIFTVAAFNAHVAGVLASLEARDGIAILVGGTGFYLRSIMQGLDTGRLPSDPGVRAQVRADLAADGLDRTVERLRALAPTLAASIERSNPRRVERALEIALLQGDVALPPRAPYRGPMLALGLAVEPVTHHDWVARRARHQFDAGLIEEAAALQSAWDTDLPAFSAIGYREAWSVLDGTRTLEGAIGDDIDRTIAFAKRQRTWFRSEPSFEWIDAGERDPTPAASTAVRAFVATGR